MGLLKRLVALLACQLADASMVFSASTDRDLKTIRDRSDHEGLSFLTITLPSFSLSFEQGLEKGQVTPSDFSAFACRKGQSLPKFLLGLTRLVFDTKTGVILDAPSQDAVEAVRQICRCFNKIKIECSPRRRAAAEAAYLSCDESIRGSPWPTSKLRYGFRRSVTCLFGNVFSRLEEDLLSGNIFPRHGPGTTEDGTRYNRKWTHPGWTARLQRCFPADHYKAVNLNEVADSEWRTGSETNPLGLSFEKERPVRVVFVPKTLKTPRVIAIEPVYNQYIQQGIARPLVRYLESTPWLRGRLNFTDQTINGAMALESSRSREWSTLDLSEASDRVSLTHVSDLFHRHKLLLKAIFACRSKYATLPSGKTIRLNKFASMGSALCFPVEAMVFHALAITAILVRRNLRFSTKNIREASRSVYTFGDDIIVPTVEASAVCDGLGTAGLKVNHHKSYFYGGFRESCGIDAYNGVIVTPVYIRTTPPCSRRDASEVTSWVSTANQFYRKGWWKTTQWIRDYIESICGVVPHSGPDSGACTWFSFLGYRSLNKWNDQLHRFEVRALRAVPSKQDDRIDGYRALHKFFISRESVDSEPLAMDAYTKSVRRSDLRLKSCWIPA